MSDEPDPIDTAIAAALLLAALCAIFAVKPHTSGDAISPATNVSAPAGGP